MGFWGNLGKIGGVIGGAVAAPFTAGTSLSWLPALLGGAGQVLGGAASGAAKGQYDQSQLALQQQQLALQAARDALEAPLKRGAAAARGSAMANLQDVSLGGTWQNPWAQAFSGGLRPSLLTPDARSLGALMAQQALRGQQTDKGYAGIAQQYPLPQAGFWQKAAGIGGTLGSLAGAIGGALPSGQPPAASSLGPGSPWMPTAAGAPTGVFEGLDLTGIPASGGFLARRNPYQLWFGGQ